MFVGQQFLQNVLGYSTLEAGAAILPAALLMVLVAPRSAKLVEARGARFTLLFGYVFLLARLPHDAAALEGGRAVLADRARLRLHRDRRRVRRHAGLALADRLGAGDARRDGVRHRRPPARPRRRDHAVDLRRAADGRLRRGRVGADRRRRTRTSPTATQAAAHEVVRERRGRRRSSTRSTRARSSPARRRRSSQGDDWAYTAGHRRDRCSARSLVFFMFPKHDEEKRLLALYHETDSKGLEAT